MSGGMQFCGECGQRMVRVFKDCELTGDVACSNPNCADPETALALDYSLPPAIKELRLAADGLLDALGDLAANPTPLTQPDPDPSETPSGLDWRSIDTAPQTGESILLTDGEFVHEAYWTGERWFTPSADFHTSLTEPTCWMPWPKPPTPQIETLLNGAANPKEES